MAGRTDPDPGAPDYYGLVGVDRDASQEELDSALTRAKGHYHPDQSSLAEARASRCFDRVRDAERVLTDPERRAEYDTFLDRFGREDGHAEFDEWQASGGHIDPTDWGRPGGTDDAGDRPTTDTSGTPSSSGQADTATSGERRSTASRQRSSAGRSAGASRQQTSTDRRQRGTAASDRERYRGWQGYVRGRVVGVRERLDGSRLSVLVPVAGRLNRGLDQAARPGLFVRSYVPRLGQLALVSVLTLVAFLFVGNTDSAVTLAGPLLWLLATVVLYAGGAVIWGVATVATYLFEGYGPALYTSLAALVVVSLYYLLVVFKTDQLADTGTE